MPPTTVAAAWESIYSSKYDPTKLACIHFTAGWFAAGGGR